VRPFDAAAVRDEGLACRAWLEAELQRQPRKGRWDKTVVVTHFAPSLRSADPRYGQQPGTASFCNADDDLIPRPTCGCTATCTAGTTTACRVPGARPRGWSARPLGPFAQGRGRRASTALDAHRGLSPVKSEGRPVPHCATAGHWPAGSASGDAMKILVAADGSPYTKRMLAYLAAHDEWLGDRHQYTLLHVVARAPRPRPRCWTSSC
jgi:hypothetical protein